MNDAEGHILNEGDSCLVVAGTHKGRSGRVEDPNRSETGAETITVRPPEGERFKTLAKNVKRVSAG
jgi:ribosomal protein S4E